MTLHEFFRTKLNMPDYKIAYELNVSHNTIQKWRKNNKIPYKYFKQINELCNQKNVFVNLEEYFYHVTNNH